MVQGRLLRQGKLILPKESRLIGVILREFHDSKQGGHGGILKTQKCIREVFYWKGMMTDIRRYVAACQVCQRYKYSTLAPGGLLQPLTIPLNVWEDVSMDFVEGLPKSEGYNSVLVVVDRFSKYAHFLGLKRPFTATEVAVLFIQEIVKLHGSPKTIVSDRDKVFKGLFWKELFRLAGTKLCFSTAYHPQSDGQTDVTNRGLDTYLRCYAGEKPRTWAQYLAWAKYNYNTSFHSAIMMSPFKAVYEREPPTLMGFESGSTSNADLEKRIQERYNHLELIRQHLHKAQQTMKDRVDGHRRDVKFAVGDMVFLKLCPYRQQTLARRVNEKLAARFYGPYAVAARVGKVAYRLTLLPEARIHPTFHVSQLKRAIGESLVPVSIPPQLTVEGVMETQPDEVIDARINGGTGQREVLVKWKGLPLADCT